MHTHVRGLHCRPKGRWVRVHDHAWRGAHPALRAERSLQSRAKAHKPVIMGAVVMIETKHPLSTTLHSVYTALCVARVWGEANQNLQACHHTDHRITSHEVTTHDRTPGALYRNTHGLLYATVPGARGRGGHAPHVRRGAEPRTYWRRPTCTLHTLVISLRFRPRLSSCPRVFRAFF